MNGYRHTEQDDLALFAMQLLSEEEMAAIAEHIEHCGDCRRELAVIQGDLALYAHTVDLHSPPSLARERLMKQVGREKKIVPAARHTVTELPARFQPSTEYGQQYESHYEQQHQGDVLFRNESSYRSESSYMEEYDEPPRRNFISKALPWSGWVLAAGLAVVAGTLYQERSSMQTAIAINNVKMQQVNADAAAARKILDTMNDNTAMRVTLQKPQSAPVPQGRVTYVAEKGSLLFLANNLEALPPYKVYELWLIPADGRDPMPAGTFQPDQKGNASVILPNLAKGVEAKAFGVTVEDQGGSTTPTLPIILAGT